MPRLCKIAPVTYGFVSSPHGIWASAQPKLQNPLIILRLISYDRNIVGCTPLIIASHKGFTETVRILLERGADCNARCQGQTALKSASQQNRTDVVEILKAHGAQ
ncbi:MAG: ankyrin repeat domain-containing protein [Desulfomonilaceae bacterium]